MATEPSNSAYNNENSLNYLNTTNSMPPTSTLPHQPPPPAPSTTKPPPPDPSTQKEEAKWSVDEKEAIKRRIYELKRTFHNGRYLIVRHLPRDTTEQTVRSLLAPVLIHSVNFSSSNPNVSSTNSTLNAHVLLAEPEAIENWTGKNNSQMVQQKPNNGIKIPHSMSHKGHTVSISPSSTENLLCVTCLPKHLQENEFTELVSSLGAVTYAFLMRSEKTGLSKGYGFVSYVNRDVAINARSTLDQRQIGNTLLGCDWLEPNIVTFSGLQSCCLLVDGLPKDYRELGEFRKTFSKVANPPYCQIPLSHTGQQGWGLLEYSSSSDAEDTVEALKDLTIRGHTLRIRYCTPGKRAINLYSKFVDIFSNQTNGGPLMPQPSVDKIANQLQNLAKSNPAFAESLHSIILNQMHNLKESSSPASSTPPPPGIPPPPPNALRIQVPPPGPPTFHPLISIPPPPHHIRVPPPLTQQPPPINPFSTVPQTSVHQSYHSQSPSPVLSTGGSDSSKPSLDTNLKAVLALFVSALTQPNNHATNNAVSELLNNQQLMSSLTNLVDQAGSTTNGVTQAPPSSTTKGPLLPTPSNISNDKKDAPNDKDSNAINPLLSGLLDSAGVNVTGSGQSNGSVDSTQKKGFDSILNDSANLQRLLGVLSPSQNPNVQSGLAGSVPQNLGSGSTGGIQNGVNPFSHFPPHVIGGLVPNPLGMPNMGLPPVDVLGNYSQPPTSLLQTPMYPPGSAQSHNATMSMLFNAAANSKQHQPAPGMAPGHPEFLFQPQALAPTLDPSGFLLTALPPPTPAQLYGGQSSAASMIAASQRMISPSLYQLDPSKSSAYAHHNGVPYPPMTSFASLPPVSLSQSTMSSIMTSSPGGIFSTPMKRKNIGGRMLPSPEPSPEGGYVGQHSQGLGGHYASSYTPRKKSRRN